MALALTKAAEFAAAKNAVEPQIVLEIDGVSTVFGAVKITKYCRIGDPELFIDGLWRVGGTIEIGDQEDIISLEGTGSKISQQLLPDKGSVNSVSSITVSMVDSENVVSRLLSPGVVLTDLLYNRARLYMGFQGTGYPEDYITIFNGRIDEITSGAGTVQINLVHPDQKKRQKIFPQYRGKTTAPINAGTSVIPVDNLKGVVTQSNDQTLRLYARIDDEIVRYAFTGSGAFNGCARGQLGTVATSHDINAEVSSFYVLEGNCMDLALKLMLSGVNDYYRKGVTLESIGWVSNSLEIRNALFFRKIDVTERYGLEPGDYVTITGSAVAGNNVSMRSVSSITKTSDGSYIVLSGDALAKEQTTTATVSFRSQYDTLGVGLSMTPEDVDVAEHLKWKELLLGSFDYRFYLKETIDGKDFLDSQIYAPCGAYSLPRKGRSSMGYHIGPVPSVDITILNQKNLTQPSKIKLKRTTSRHFYNTVVYAYDEDTLEDKFLAGQVTVNEDSKARIPYGNAVFQIESKGIRSDLGGSQISEAAANRRLERYKFAAEHFENVSMFFGDGFNAEPGDLVLFDFSGLQVTNSRDGTRDKPEKFYEIVNKTLDLKTGQVVFTLLDSNYDSSERYGLVSPSSVITGGTTTSLIIQDSYGAIYPGDEKRKWEDYVGLPVLVHSEDFAFSEEVVFTGFDLVNTYQMNISALSQVPQAGWVIDVPSYPESSDPSLNRKYKVIHAHLCSIVSIVSGLSSTKFTVSNSDISKFFVGAPVRLHSDEFLSYSPEVTVSNIFGNIITVNADLGFTPTLGMKCSFMGFPDQEHCYRWI